MGHERLMQMKSNLMSAIEGQMCNLYEADTEELGSAIDMLKDLEEAIYFCTITEAMTGKNKNYGDFNVEIENEGQEKQKNGHHQGGQMMYYTEPNRMYNTPYMYTYDESPYMYNQGSYRMYAENSNSSRGNQGGNRGSSSSNYSEPMMRDHREGRSPESRRMYLEAKEQQQDKATQLRELEKYMQELTQDMVEMIQDSTIEEKQYLEKKISALASKIG